MSTDTTIPTDPTDVAAAAERVVDTYLAAWNETDRSARADLVAASLGADLWYRDPMLAADGLDAFHDIVEVVQSHFPGTTMRRTSPIDQHHDVVRFHWALGADGAEPVTAGVDMAKLDADGKLHRIVGFTPAALADA